MLTSGSVTGLLSMSRCKFPSARWCEFFFVLQALKHYKLNESASSCQLVPLNSKGDKNLPKTQQFTLKLLDKSFTGRGELCAPCIHICCTPSNWTIKKLTNKTGVCFSFCPFFFFSLFLVFSFDFDFFFCMLSGPPHHSWSSFTLSCPSSPGIFLFLRVCFRSPSHLNIFALLPFVFALDHDLVISLEISNYHSSSHEKLRL